MHIPEKIDPFIIPGGPSDRQSLSCCSYYDPSIGAEKWLLSLKQMKWSMKSAVYINRLSDYFFVITRLVNHRLEVKDTVYKRSAKIFRKKRGRIVMYPVMMNIQNKPVVIIGGGKVAARKIKTLLSEGAKVTVISPEINEVIPKSLGLNGFKGATKLGVWKGQVVFACTDNQEVNKEAMEERT